MGLFRRGPPDLATLVEARVQLVAEVEAVDADAAWMSVSDDAAELAESRSLCVDRPTFGRMDEPDGRLPGAGVFHGRQRRERGRFPRR